MKILVRLPNWLGDVIMSTAFVNALKKQYAHAEIHLIAKKELAAVAACIDGIDGIHLFSKAENPGTMGAIRFGRRLKSFHFDLFFSLPDSFSSALIGYASKAKKRVGFKNEMRSFLLTTTYKKPTGLHRVEEYINLLEQYTQTKNSSPKVSLKPKDIAINRSSLLVNFNSEASSRRLPLEKAIALTQTILKEFPNRDIGFIGSPKESPYITNILAAIEDTTHVTNYAGKTSLKELIGLLASCEALLTTDSGPAHLANSLNRPCVVLFGAGNEKNTAPYNKEKLSVIRAARLNCEPCVKNTCMLYPTPECMNLLDEQRIIDELKTFLVYDQ